MEDFTWAEQKCRYINNIFGCWLLECLTCITSSSSSVFFFFNFSIFNKRLLWNTLPGSGRFDTAKPKGILEMFSAGAGVQMFSIIQDQAVVLTHLKTSTHFTVVFQQVDLHWLQQDLNLLAIPDSGSNPDFPSPCWFFFACSFWSDHRQHYIMLMLAQSWFMNALVLLYAPRIFKILST